MKSNICQIDIRGKIRKLPKNKITVKLINKKVNNYDIDILLSNWQDCQNTVVMDNLVLQIIKIVKITITFA